jgi:hypothetical protein
MEFKSNINSVTYDKHSGDEEYPTGKANGSHQFSIIFTLRLVQNSGPKIDECVATITQRG